MPFGPAAGGARFVPTGSWVHFEVLEPAKRPVSAVADVTEVRDVREVVVSEDPDHEISLLFDSTHDLQERILREQFDH